MNHRIHSIQCQFNYEGFQYRPVAKQLDSFFRQQITRCLPGILQKVLDQYDSDQLTIQLDKLELELDPIDFGQGAKPYESFQNQMVAQLETILAEKCEFRDEVISLSAQNTKEGNLKIENAGLVLFWVYLEPLFKQLDWLEDTAFKSAETAKKAVALLQMMATNSTEGVDGNLKLNKLLCGLPQELPLPNLEPPGPDEMNLAEQLMSAVVQHWKALGNTSIEGLRASFVQRNGTLEWSDDCWKLTVEDKTYDMLLDRLPWLITPIKLPWMPSRLEVEWRPS